MLTPEEIEGRAFRAEPDGYDRREVDAFLADLAASVRADRARLAASSAEGDPFAVLGQEVADILRATEQAAARKRAELETELGARRAEVDIALEESRQRAEREHEQAKRLLVRAQQRADTIVAEAEEQARARIRRADVEARQRTDVVVERARRREERLVEAERAAAERIRALRAQLAAVLDGAPLDDPGPVLDLTEGEAVLRTADEGAGSERPGTIGVVRDPLDHLVRAAVARAQEHPVRADDDPDRQTGPALDVDPDGHPASGNGRA